MVHSWDGNDRCIYCGISAFSVNTDFVEIEDKINCLYEQLDILRALGTEEFPE